MPALVVQQLAGDVRPPTARALPRATTRLSGVTGNFETYFDGSVSPGAQALTAGEISFAETHRYGEATADRCHSPGTPLSDECRGPRTRVLTRSRGCHPRLHGGVGHQEGNRPPGCRDRKPRRCHTLQPRIGLNSGQVIAGEIGSGTFGYTAIGEQVGMASGWNRSRRPVE